MVSVMQDPLLAQLQGTQGDASPTAVQEFVEEFGGDPILGQQQGPILAQANPNQLINNPLAPGQRGQEEPPANLGPAPPGFKWWKDELAGRWVLIGAEGPGPGGGVFMGDMVSPVDMDQFGYGNYTPGSIPGTLDLGLQDMIDSVGLGGEFGIWDYWLLHNAKIEQARKDREMKMLMWEQYMDMLGSMNTEGGARYDMEDISVYNTQGGGAATTAPGGAMANAIAGDVPNLRAVAPLGSQIAAATGGPGWRPRSLDEGIMAQAANMPLEDAFRSVDARRIAADAPGFAKAERGALDDIITARAEADLGSGDWIQKARASQQSLVEQQARLDAAAKQQRLQAGLRAMEQITGATGGGYDPMSGLGGYQQLLTG